MNPHESRRLLFLFLFAADICYGAPPDSLRFTQILFRHGDRTPTQTFPTNPYGPESWPNGLEQLTQKGMRQARDLGLFIRERYDGFLNSTYVADQVYVRSTDKDRTLMSASSLLAGLYPPQGFQVWDPQIPWQPIPVHTRPYDDDIEMTSNVRCKLYSGLYADALLSDDAMKLYLDNKEMMDYVAEKAGWDLPTLPNIFDVYDPLFCMTQHPELGLTMPEWVTQEIFRQIEEFNFNYHIFHNYTPTMRTLLSGSFIRMMTNRMKEAAQGEYPLAKKMLLYSSHDTLQVAFMMALDIWDQRKPEYCATIFFELHEQTPGAFTVQLFYRNGNPDTITAEPVLLTLPGCDASCPLDKFLNIMEPHKYKGTVEQWREECDMVKSSNGAMIAVTVLAVCFVVVVIVFLVVFLKARASRPNYDAV